MDYNRPFFTPDDISIPIPNPGQHPSAPVQMLRRENYHLMHNPMTHSMMALSGHVHAPTISPVEDTDELDTSSRPRLTQEQIATLEDNFKGRPKPDTDFKKHLASQIGLSLQRVNNWYQNRRAKARHQKPQERSFDVLPIEPDVHWATPNIVFPNFQTGQDQFEDVSQQIPTGDLMSIPNHGLVELSKSCSPDLNRLQMEPAVGPASIKVFNTDVFSAEADQLITSSETDFSDFNGGLPLMPDWDISNWIADTPMDSPFKNEEILQFGAHMDAYSHPMYPLSSQGLDAANSSCQTFVSTSSSDGDTCLMTPPPKTSPMPTLPPDLETRRGSSSSELAKNFDTIRLQQPRSRNALRDEVLFCSPPRSDSGTVPERPLVSEPQTGVSGSQTVTGFGRVGGKTSPIPRIDLASRRKRPRPAALRPDSQRSLSCTAPLTLSPHSQVSSCIGIGSSPSVRRIRSTGQNLNVASGGVQKPGLRSAQLSPRNFQSFFDATGTRHMSPIKREYVDVTQDSPSNGKPPTPLTPGKVEFQPDAWSNFAAYCPSPAFRWDHHDQATPYAFGTGQDISSPPITPFNVDAFPQMYSSERPHGSSYQCPPQSAPPEQTNFLFGDSPTVVPAANQSAWQLPSSTVPISTYPDDSTIAMARQSQMPPMNFSRLNFQPMGPPQHYSHGLPAMTSGRLGFFGITPAPPKEIEIQVNLIPKPQGVPQPRKQYEFSHTTPKDFSPSVYAS